MNPYNFYRVLQLIGWLVGIPLAGVIFCTATIINQLRTEAHYRSQFGGAWQLQYEKDFGSLGAAHTRLVVAALGIVVLCGISVWLYKLLRHSGQSRRHKHSRKSHRERHTSPLEHTARCRRNAVLGVYFGVVGILAGLFLVIFRTGLFADHANELVLGMFVFLGGYAGVIAGCSWWLKAKQWNEAIVLIGLMPVAVCLIPYVRLVFFAVPMLLVSGMVMMPLILIVVVVVLPDRSGQSGRGGWGRGHHRRHHHPGQGWTQVNESQPEPAQAAPGAPAETTEPPKP